MMIRASVFLSLALVLPAGALAETVTLIDGTKITGEIVHAYRGEYTVKHADGEVVLDRKKIKTISFETPVAREIYATPEKTLAAWRAASGGGDVAGMIDAYALMYQGMVAQEMDSMDFREKSRMIADVASTTFRVKESEIDGSKAVLTVEQEKDGETRTGNLRFVLEAGEWKMTP